MSESLSDQYATTPLSGGNAPFVESLYEQFLADPASVDPQWREYFERLRGAPARETPHGPLRAALLERAQQPRAAVPGSATDARHEASAKQGAVSRLIQVYANRGHLVAKLDPLGLMQRPLPRVLDIEYFGLSSADLDTEFFTGSRVDKAVPQFMKLKDILEQLQFIYCDTIGAEFAHVSDSEERLWLQDRYQEGRVLQRFSAEEKRVILWQLSAAEGLERYLHTKYLGQKRFSLEGGESLIPLLDDLIQQGGVEGVEEMRHRHGAPRPPQRDREHPRQGPERSVLPSSKATTSQRLKGSGDVKYHMGFSTDLNAGGQRCTSRSRSTRRTSRSSTPSSTVACARSRSARRCRAATRWCRSSSTATPRSRVRASCPRRCSCRGCPASTPAAPCT